MGNITGNQDKGRSNLTLVEALREMKMQKLQVGQEKLVMEIPLLLLKK